MESSMTIRMPEETDHCKKDKERSTHRIPSRSMSSFPLRARIRSASCITNNIDEHPERHLAQKYGGGVCMDRRCSKEGTD